MMSDTREEQERVTSEIRTAVRHTAVYGLGSVLAKALGFLMIPFYTRHLSPGDYGVLEILDLTMSLFGLCLNLGMTTAVLRSYGNARTDEDRAETVSSAFLFVLFSGILTFVLGLPLIRPVSAVLFGASVPPGYLFMAFGALIANYVSNLPRTYLRAREKSGAFVIVDALCLIGLVILNVYFIAVLKMGPAGILLSSLIVGATTAVLLSVWMVRKEGTRFNRAVLWEMIRFGAPLIFSNLALFTINFSDRFFLQHLRSLDAVGLYAVGYKFGYMINYFVVQPFFVMWQGRMYVIHAQSEHPKVFSQIFVLYSLLITYAALAMAILSPEIVRLMVDAKFSGAQTVIPIVAFAYAFNGIGYYAQLGMYLADRTSLVGLVSAVTAVLNLILNYYLIGRFGELGAAWATLLGFLTMAAASYWISQRVFPLPLSVGRVGAAIGLAVALYGVAHWWSPLSLAGTVLLKVVLLTAYPLFLWKAGVLTRGEIETISSASEALKARVAGALGRRTRPVTL
jgi:O-antigen/teichoic acid export membrane protein